MRFEFDVECLTPLFTAGGDPNATRFAPEAVLAEGLRPAEIRGALRFWFRAAVGGYLTLEDMHYRESLVFGGTETGKTMRVATYPVAEVSAKPAYPRMNNDRNRRNVVKNAISSGSRFRLTVETFREPCTEDAYWLRALALLSMLGGVGGRTRRGFGSLHISLIKPTRTECDFRALGWPGMTSYSDFDTRATSPNNLLAYSIVTQISHQLKALWRLAGSSLDNTSDAFSVLTQSHAQILVISPQQGGFWPDWGAAMNNLREDFYYHLKDYLNTDAIGYARGQSRLASPLAIQIKRCPLISGGNLKQGYFGIAVVFKHSNSARELTFDTNHTFETFLKTQQKLRIEQINPFPVLEESNV